VRKTGEVCDGKKAQINNSIPLKALASDATMRIIISRSKAHLPLIQNCRKKI
jgi:hypothetical protein